MKRMKSMRMLILSYIIQLAISIFCIIFQNPRCKVPEKSLTIYIGEKNGQIKGLINMEMLILSYSPVSILYKSIAGCYRPVRVADGPITVRYRFIKNASWVNTSSCTHFLYQISKS